MPKLYKGKQKLVSGKGVIRFMVFVTACKTEQKANE